MKNFNSSYFHQIRLLDSCSPSLFKEILETQVFSELIDYLNYEAPCSLIGFFMKLVGNCLLRHIYILKEKHVFYPSHEILGVQLLNGGEMLISTKKTTNCGDIFGKFKTNVHNKNQTNLHIKLQIFYYFLRLWFFPMESSKRFLALRRSPQNQ